MTNETKVAAKKTRTKSKETTLKQERLRIQKALAVLDKRVEAFEAMEAEMEEIDTQRIALGKELDDVKASLIQELGLG